MQCQILSTFKEKDMILSNIMQTQKKTEKRLL
jgi:hypothetical protein